MGQPGLLFSGKPGREKTGTARGLGRLRREASMKIQMAQPRSLLATILALIGGSPIAVATPMADLPAGFSDVDVAVLDWIAAEGRRIRREYVH